MKKNWIRFSETLLLATDVRNQNVASNNIFRWIVVSIQRNHFWPCWWRLGLDFIRWNVVLQMSAENDSSKTSEILVPSNEVLLVSARPRCHAQPVACGWVSDPCRPFPAIFNGFSSKWKYKFLPWSTNIYVKTASYPTDCIMLIQK